MGERISPRSLVNINITKQNIPVLKSPTIFKNSHTLKTVSSKYLKSLKLQNLSKTFKVFFLKFWNFSQISKVYKITKVRNCAPRKKKVACFLTSRLCIGTVKSNPKQGSTVEVTQWPMSRIHSQTFGLQSASLVAFFGSVIHSTCSLSPRFRSALFCGYCHPWQLSNGTSMSKMWKSLMQLGCTFTNSLSQALFIDLKPAIQC